MKDLQRIMRPNYVSEWAVNDSDNNKTNTESFWGTSHYAKWDGRSGKITVVKLWVEKRGWSKRDLEAEIINTWELTGYWASWRGGIKDDNQASDMSDKRI